MDSFSFGIDTSVSIKNQAKLLESPILESKSTGSAQHLLFLIETYPPNPEAFTKALRVLFNLEIPTFDYTIMVATKLKVNRDEVQRMGVFRFYQENSSPWLSHVREGSTIVMASGYALQAVTLAKDLSTECFYDYIFNNTYFYSTRSRTNVFPVDSHEQLFRYDRIAYYPIDCSRYEFLKLQLRKIKAQYNTLKDPDPPTRLKIIQVTTRGMWLNLCEVGKKAKKISWDIESNGLDTIRNDIGCLTISFDGISGYYVPWDLVDVTEFDEVLEGKYQIGANKKFDDKFVRKYGVKNAYTHSDILQLGHLLNEMRFNGMKSLAYHYTQHGGYDYALDQFIQKFKPKNYLEIPILPNYAAQDAIHAFNIEKAMQEQLTELDKKFPPEVKGGWTMRRFYEEVIMPFQNMFIDIELQGISTDPVAWGAGALILQNEILSLKETIRKQLDRKGTSSFENLFEVEFDSSEDSDELTSGKQLGEIIEGLGWENLGRTKNGWFKTADEQLMRWEQLGHPEAVYIQKLRSYLTLQKTFMGNTQKVGGWRDYVLLPDGTIHPSYMTMLAETFRNKCQKPNWQQIPSTSKNLGDKIELFKRIITVPDPKKQYLVTCDLASAQIRLATIDSQDKVLTKAYKENEDLDIHSKTGFNIFCKGKKFLLDEVVLDIDGKERVFFPHEVVKIVRNGEKVEVKALNILETDKVV